MFESRLNAETASCVRERTHPPRAAKKVLTSLFLVAACLSTHVPSSASPWPKQSSKLEERLRAAAPEERRRLTAELIYVPRAQALAAVRVALWDSEAEVRQTAADVALYFRFSGLAGEVASWLQSRVPGERERAVELISLSPNAEGVKLLGSLLSDSDRNLRKASAKGLGRARRAEQSQAQDELLGALDDPEAEVREEVATSLGLVGDGGATLALSAHLKDAEVSVREQVAVALGVIGDSAATPALVVALSDSEPSVVAAAVDALSDTGDTGAVPALVQVARRRPVDEPVKRAIFGLNRFAGLGDPSATRELGELLLEAETQRAALLALDTMTGPSALQVCLSRATVGLLEACAARLVSLGGELDSVLALHEAGRLTDTQVLNLLQGKYERRAAVLALELLASGPSAGAEEALRYLTSLEGLPAAIAVQLRELVGAYPWTGEDKQRFFSALSAARSAEMEQLGKDGLNSVDPLLRKAAAALLVSSGASQETLLDLLFNERAEVASGAFGQLKVAQTASQSGVLIESLIEGRRGRRALLLDQLASLSPETSRASVTLLERLLRVASGAERDKIFTGLGLHGDEKVLIELSRRGSSADQAKLAQIAIFHPKGAAIARALLSSKYPRVVALSAQTLGLRGERKDLKSLEALLLPTRENKPQVLLHYQQAAILEALTRLTLRVGSTSEAQGALTKERCNSPHTGVRAASLGLSAALGVACADVEVASLVMNLDDARLRKAAAAATLRVAPHDRALRRCHRYEPRVDVAAACTQKSAPLEQKTAADGEVPAAPKPVFQVVELKGLTGVSDPVIGLPVVVNSSLGQLVLVSDRAGRVLLPAGEFEFGDPVFAY